MKLWCVKVTYYYDEEAPRDTLECDVKLFTNEEDAVKELNSIIANDWTAEVEVNGDTKLLADCRGMQQDESSRRFSDWYYSEDGKLAWAVGTTHAYKGQVVEIGVQSEAKGD